MDTEAREAHKLFLLDFEDSKKHERLDRWFLIKSEQNLADFYVKITIN